MGRQTIYSQAIEAACQQVRLLRDGDSAQGELIHDFPCDDGIKIIASTDVSVSYCTIADTLAASDKVLKQMAHRDCIQIIPTVQGQQRQQYALAATDGIQINDNHLFACGTNIQGIFASDGIHRNLIIVGNMIKGSASQHIISINGLISGLLAANYGDEGLARIQLDPARICDGLYILGFKDPEDDYQPISDIIGDKSLNHVIDNRCKITRPNAIYLSDFDLKGYRQEAEKIAIDDLPTYCTAIKNLAMDFGSRVFWT